MKTNNGIAIYQPITLFNGWEGASQNFNIIQERKNPQRLTSLRDCSFNCAHTWQGLLDNPGPLPEDVVPEAEGTILVLAQPEAGQPRRLQQPRNVLSAKTETPTPLSQPRFLCAMGKKNFLKNLADLNVCF